MTTVEPVGSLYAIEIEDTSKTSSGIVLSGNSNNYVVARIIKTPVRKRMNANGLFITPVANTGERVIVAKSNIVEIRVGTVDSLFTSDESIIAVIND